MESRIKFTRYHGLDAFRCFAMLMGLVIHAPLIFEIPEIVGLENAYKYLPSAGIILSWIHSWRMPAFFILSGIFTQFIITNRGAKYFLFDRFIRILIPVLIVTTVLNFFWDQSFQTLYHLWFFYYLFIIHNSNISKNTNTKLEFIPDISSSNKVEISNPTFKSKGLNSNPYEISALKGIQIEDDLELTEIKGKFQNNEGEFFYIKARITKLMLLNLLIRDY